MDIPVNSPGEDKAVQKKYDSMASFFLKLQTFRLKLLMQHKGRFDAVSICQLKESIFKIDLSSILQF